MVQATIVNTVRLVGSPTIDDLEWIITSVADYYSWPYDFVQSAWADKFEFPCEIPL